MSFSQTSNGAVTVSYPSTRHSPTRLMRRPIFSSVLKVSPGSYAGSSHSDKRPIGRMNRTHPHGSSKCQGRFGGRNGNTEETTECNTWSSRREQSRRLLPRLAVETVSQNMGGCGHSFFADVFVPDRGVLRDVGRQHVDAFFGAQVDDFNTILSQPIDAAAEIHRLPDNHGSDAELADQTAAIPARCEGCDHNLVAITSLAARSSKRVGLSVCGWIALLHPSVVSPSEGFLSPIKQRGADGNPPVG